MTQQSDAARWGVPIRPLPTHDDRDESALDPSGSTARGGSAPRRPGRSRDVHAQLPRATTDYRRRGIHIQRYHDR
ncbi:hypothetical protein [Halopiger goleimassiliensis]|uniref:hypothetical protein n=1 Tax=Halopiger goleimassiliensis TaxID=1293048 RepID=UPI0012B63E1B|nr:hypothetical protein [Halopiger goleimassiliensis]